MSVFCTQMGFPGGSVGKESTCNVGDTGRHGLNPQVGKIPWRRAWLEKTIIQIDTCTLMFIAALFAIARTWKQPRYPNKCMYNCCSERWYEMTTLNRLI